MTLVCQQLALPQFLRSSKCSLNFPCASSSSSLKCTARCLPTTHCSLKIAEGLRFREKGCQQICGTSSLVSGVSLREHGGVHRKQWKRPQRGHGMVQASLNSGGKPGGGGNSQQETIIRNLLGAGLLVILTYTGVLRVAFDIIASLWILFMLLVLGAIGSYAAFVWWAQSKLLLGTCPSCGQEFKALEETPLNQNQICPYCTAPFEVVGKKFVRVEPQFSPDPFAGFGFNANKKQGQSKNWKADGIVDIEAEVMDKD